MIEPKPAWFCGAQNCEPGETDNGNGMTGKRGN